MNTHEIGVRTPRPSRERSIFSYVYEATGVGMFAVMLGVILVIYSSFAPPAKAEPFQRAGRQPGFAGGYDPLPIRRGAYAIVGQTCEVGGNYGRYDSLLTYFGNSLNNSSMGRTIIGMSSQGSHYSLQLRTVGIRDEEKPETVSWTIVVTNREFFTVVGHDHDTDWSGSYRYCGKDALHLDRRQADLSQDHVDIHDSTTTDSAEGLLFDHNGSDVLYFADKGLIVYTRPKPSMRSVVKSGDVLFRGTIRGHVLVGQAYAFKAGCRPAPYDVRGVLLSETASEGARLHLHGAAPSWDRASCRVVTLSYYTPNADLAFTQLRGPELEARLGGDPH